MNGDPPLEANEAAPPESPANLACPFCMSALAPGAAKCAACGANVGDIRICPACAEPVRASAAVCPFCRSELAPPAPRVPELMAEPWVIYASPLGALIVEQSPTALFFPPVLTVTEKEIHIQRRSFLGLRTLDMKLSVSRIASVRASQGIIWGGILIETYGGSAGGDLAINGLDKQEARETARIIERIANLTPGRPELRGQ